MKTKAFLIVYWVVHTVTHISWFNQICLLPGKYLRSGFKDQRRISGQVCSEPSGKKDLKGLYAREWGAGGRGRERK